jgi:hypothetical protein
MRPARYSPSMTCRRLHRASCAGFGGPALLSALIEIKAGRPMQAVVGRQGARPVQGLSSTFTSACAFGALLATLQIAGCSIELITTASWKAAMGLSKDKAQSLDRARLLYPTASLDRKKDHGRGEAILLATFALNRASRASGMSGLFIGSAPSLLGFHTALPTGR